LFSIFFFECSKTFPSKLEKKPFKLLLLLLLLLPPTSLKTNPILLSCFQHKTWQNKTEEANTNKRREKREES
jgi:hypothetical protein